jgi:hypothetical protein
MKERASSKPAGTIALIFLGVLSGGAGCDEPGPRIYTAMAYEPGGMCLDNYAPLGRVESVDLAGTCSPVCLSDGAGQLYVSTVCPPYPDGFTPVDIRSAGCASALAALDAGTSCGAASPAPEGGADQ